jgi:secondary thiamine-phosphate synthase enzyme
MHIHHNTLEVRTAGKGLYEITDELQSTIDRGGIRSGTVTVFVQHTSCSIILMENADPTARSDLEEFFNRLVPEDIDYFAHASEGASDAREQTSFVANHCLVASAQRRRGNRLNKWRKVK